MARRHRRWIVNVSLACFAVIVALAGMEFGVRVFFPQPTGLSHLDPYGLTVHWPGITRHLPQYGTTVSFNAIGMRDREHRIDKAPGAERVLLLGDSFMEALQVPWEDAFPALLERKLTSRLGREVEVISAAVSGWGTDDELRYLEMYGLAWKPDVVVVAMTLHNDISDNLRQEWHTITDGELVAQPREPFSYWRFKIVEAKGFLATRFQLYQLWRRVRHGGDIRQARHDLDSHIVQLFRVPEPGAITKGYELTEGMLGRVRQVAAANGAVVVLMLLPLRVQITDSVFSQFRASANAAAGDMPEGKPQRTMSEIATGLGIPVVDLLPSFEEWSTSGGAPLFLQWDGHWSAQGHQLAADTFVEAVTGEGLFLRGP